MADNKDTFLFYTKWLSTFKSLPKDKGYDLLMHILAYVNDENPQTDDVLINAVFQNIQIDLKSDLKKWELSIEEKSRGGSVGNLKRWHPDVYKRYIKGKISLQEAINITTDRKASHTDNIPSLPIAEIAVYVNDNVLDNKDNSKTQVVPTSDVDVNKFISYFNSKANRNFKATDKVKAALKARVKNYSKLEIQKAIDNAHLDQYHLETNFKYLTPEFILRIDKLEKFINQNSNNNTSQGITIQTTN